MRSCVRLLALSALIAGCSAPLPPGEAGEFAKAGSFELYSLEPLKDGGPGLTYDPKGPGERLHGWPVLGKTTVSDRPTRRAIVDALSEALGKGKSATCFYPRHAIRRVSDGKTTDLVICFECGNVSVYTDGKRTGDGETIKGSAQPAFDEALRKAGVPLATKK